VIYSGVMKFERTEEYESKLFEQALFDEKRVYKDAKIRIVHQGNKLKAYCIKSGTFLQFPRRLRSHGACFIADVVEVIREDGVRKYYRAMPKSIRNPNSDEVIG
jgi:hypothetical protein